MKLYIDGELVGDRKYPSFRLQSMFGGDRVLHIGHAVNLNFKESLWSNLEPI